MAAPRKDNVNKLIMEATEKLLKEKTISEISLAEIARNAGISKGTLYYHYRSKEDIIFALMDQYLDQQWQELIKWTSDADKDTSLPRFIKYILERDTDNVGLRFHFLYDSAAGNQMMREKLLTRYERFANVISEKIAERNRDIDPDYLAWFILILADGLLIHKNLENPEVDTGRFIKDTEKYARQIFDGNTESCKKEKN